MITRINVNGEKTEGKTPNEREKSAPFSLPLHPSKTREQETPPRPGWWVGWVVGGLVGITAAHLTNS